MSNAQREGLAEFLAKRPWALSLWATTAAFGTYFCMYGFRKPFTAAGFSEPILDHWDQKGILVSSQVIGYLLSKIIGIRVIAEMPATRRGMAILVLIGLSHISLLLFAIVPSPFHIACLFLNGLPLGLVFGLVLGFLEGRRLTEALAAGLCASFILASGFCKSVGSWLLEMDISERWMPFVAGLLFYLPLCMGVWMLVRIPRPNEEDILHRSQREPMNRENRLAFLQKYAIGLGALATIYFLFTILRSLRDDFAPELWRGLQVAVVPSVYSWTDLYVASLVLLINACSVMIRDNKRALLVSLGTSLFGAILIVVSLVAQHQGWISPLGFMVGIGLGLYLPYVAMHTTIFERMIATTRDRGNIGFLMYVVDSLGYAGYVVVMVIRQGTEKGTNILPFFTIICWISALLSIVLLMVAMVYFARLKNSDR